MARPGPVLPSENTAPAGAGAAFLAFVRRRPIFLAGYVIVAAVTLMGAIAPFLPLRSPVDANPGDYLVAPNLAYPMGTDIAGLDILSRVIHAPRVDLAIALFSTTLAAVIGGLIGALLGLWDGRRGPKGLAAVLAMRLADVVQAFPVFALALVLVAVLGQGIPSIVLAIGIVNVPVYLRLMRAQTLAIRTQPFVEAAQLAGAGDAYTLGRHVLPNALAVLLAQVASGIGAAVLLTAGLSFIGAGVRAPTPEWGSMIASGFQNVITGQWWPSLFPGLALALTIFGFSAVGASIEAWCNPRERTRTSRRDWAAFVASRARSPSGDRPAGAAAP